LVDAEEHCQINDHGGAQPPPALGQIGPDTVLQKHHVGEKTGDHEEECHPKAMHPPGQHLSPIAASASSHHHHATAKQKCVVDDSQ
jgi:hypothetical protein